jgi:apolipoprotein N-acyltransferase
MSDQITITAKYKTAQQLKVLLIVWGAAACPYLQQDNNQLVHKFLSQQSTRLLGKEKKNYAGSENHSPHEVKEK